MIENNPINRLPPEIAEMTGQNPLLFQISALEKTVNELSRQLCLASQIQYEMLPESMPVVEGYKFSAAMIPAKESGGDFYDATIISPTTIGVLLADVSDKDIHAALFMAQARGIFQTIMRYCDGSVTPEQKIRKLNSVLYEINRSNMFIAIIYIEINTETNELSYVRAGNYPIQIFHKNGTTENIPRKTGQVVGLCPDENLLLDTGVIYIEDGDVAVMISDGIIDETNRISREFGIECLSDEVQSSLEENPDIIRDNILNAVNIHRENTPPVDDCTVIVFKRTKLIVK
jgi:phosphoserine phosphatase RsbU/P